MNKVAITTNSACISAEEAKKYGITLIPFHIIIDGKDYLDPEVDMESLYARLDKKENLPTAAPFSVEECLQAFPQLSQNAAEMAAQGKDLSEITEFVNHLIPEVNFLSTRDTLFYLDKGGRVFEAKSWAEAESMLSFRAIVEIDAHSEG